MFCTAVKHDKCMVSGTSFCNVLQLSGQNWCLTRFEPHVSLLTLNSPELRQRRQEAFSSGLCSDTSSSEGLGLRL